MNRIPDTVNVASLDTHCLIVTVPNHGPADVASSLPRTVAADLLRQIADSLEGDTGSCGFSIATGRPCPVHDVQAAPRRPRSIDDLLDHLADRIPDDGEQQATPPPSLADAFAEFGRHLRTAMEQTTAGTQQHDDQPTDTRRDSTATADTEQADGDPRPVIEVDLAQPTEPGPIEEHPATPARIQCAHGYVLMQDSCPGCDAEQDTPHEADPVTVRPRWAKGTMRRCRRCALRPSHYIHKAQRNTE